jgi:C4-dicarboxylate transporter DctM subunit
MSPLIICIIGLVVFLIFMALGMRIAFAFMLVGFLGVFFLKDFDIAASLLARSAFVWASNGSLIALPLFVLMGFFVFQGGIGMELYDFAHKWVGRFPGGLAVATEVAGTIFGACCGVSMGAAATFGTISYPEMEAHHYSRRLSTGAICAGGSLSSLIPPSVPFIIYGALTEVSVGEMFIAGIVPGLLLSGLFIIVTLVICRLNPSAGPRGESYSLKEMLISLKGVIAVLVLFIIVIGGLFIGVFAPSEAGAIGAFGAFVIALARRRLNRSSIVAAVIQGLKTSCFILTITIGAMIFANFLAVGGFTGMFRDWIGTFQVSPHVIMLFILIIYIPLGMFMDALAMILLTIPIVFPVVQALGFDPIWFGILITILAEIGLLTPPVGLNAYVVSGVTKVPLEDVFSGITPFFIVMLVGVVIMYLCPQVVTFLPSLIK